MRVLSSTAVVTGLLLAAGIALGQYSGTFTIMPSGGDFASHAEAADSLMAYGVTGSCTLLMHTGTYYGQARLDSADWDSVEVVFLAAPGESPEVRAASPTWLIIHTDNITVDGINTTVTDSIHGYLISYSSGTKVRNQDINATPGAFIRYSNATAVENCNINSTDDGLTCRRSNATVVENCNINSTYDGLVCRYSDSCRAIGNRIRAGGHGIRSISSGYRYIVGNNITAGGLSGISGGSNVAGSGSYYDTIAVNMMSGTNNGIHHRYHYHSYVYGNTFYGSNVGYHSDSGYHESFYSNIFVCGGSYPLYKNEGNAPAGSDYNCFCGDASYVAYYNGSHTLASWRGLGYDSSGMHADPLVGGPIDLHLRTGSPCIDSGMAHPLWPLDIDGEPIHNGVRDIGADEWVGTGVAEGGAKAERRAPGPTILRGPALARMNGRVLDVQGRDVTERKHALAPGIYFVRREEGSSTTKVVVQR